MNEKTVLQKTRALVFAHAVADALGVPVEFEGRDTLAIFPIEAMMGYGTHNVPVGTWSDDTSMSLAALDVLADGELDYGRIMQGFADWYHGKRYVTDSGVFDVGGCCARAVSRYLSGCEPLTCGGVGEWDCGNGSLMRIYPFVLLAYVSRMGEADAVDMIAKASSLTHGHKTCTLACGIYYFVLRALLERPEKESAREALLRAAEFFSECDEIHHFDSLFRYASGEVLTEGEIASGGYAPDTLCAAVWCLLETESYRECALKAVNLGDDTDTTAAVAGALAGALYGYDSIPDGWLSSLREREMIDGMCRRFASTWGD